MKKTLSLLGALLIVICLSSVRAAADGTVLSPQKLTAEGRSAECEMYNIGGSNYMKLRDAAFLLSGTVSRFSVERDESTGALSVFTGRPYVPDGSELDLSAGDRSASAVPCAVTVTIDGIARDDLSAYDIGGSSFFRLRDLGGCLGFFVSYDRDCDTVIVKSLADVKNPDPWLPGAEYELGAGRVSATVNTYDPGGVLIKTEYAEHPGGTSAVTEYAYGSDGLLASVSKVDCYGVAVRTEYSYDASGGRIGERCSSSLGDSYEICRAFDEDGRLLSYVYENGSGYSFRCDYGYDESGNRLFESCESNSGVYYRYDYTYDAEGRMLAENFVSEDNDPSVSLFGYDAEGRLVYEDYSSGDYSYRKELVYDPDGRLISDTLLNSDGESFRSGYTYGENGRLLRSLYEADGFRSETAYLYDASGALIARDHADSDGEGYRILYDGSGRVLFELYFSGGAASEENSYFYDALGNVLSYCSRSADGLSEYRFYSYDYAAGRYASLTAYIETPDY